MKSAEGDELPSALILAEFCADTGGDVEQLRKAAAQLGARGGYSAAWAYHSLLLSVLYANAHQAAQGAAFALSQFAYYSELERNELTDHDTTEVRATEATAAERLRITAIANCIFGNPFRPVVFDPRWRTETAVALAAGTYEERAFDRLPILADALEEAGCDHADVLAHCRSPAPHARGCWVVDLVLGKS